MGAMGIMTTPYQVGYKSGVSPEHPIFNSVLLQLKYPGVVEDMDHMVLP